MKQFLVHLLRNETVSEQRIDIAIYGLRNMGFQLLVLFVILIIGAFLDIFNSTCITLLFLVLVRSRLGSHHCNNRTHCLILSIVLTLGLISLIDFCGRQILSWLM